MTADGQSPHYSLSEEVACSVIHGLGIHHAIWHVFVLAGSIFHFFAVLFYVIPLA